MQVIEKATPAALNMFHVPAPSRIPIRPALKPNACYERHRLALGDDELPGAFLLAEDALLRTAHATCRQRVGDATGSKAVAVIRELLAPYDRAGVLDPASRHMIHRSAVE